MIYYILYIYSYLCMSVGNVGVGKKFKRAGFFRELVEIFSTFFFDTRRMSKHSSSVDAKIKWKM